MRIIEGVAAARAFFPRRVFTGLDSPEQEQLVRQIVSEVRRQGDDAIREYTEKFDGVRLGMLEVPREAVAAAAGKVDKTVTAALEKAARRIEDFHREQKNRLFSGLSGRKLGWLVRPLRRVGVHVPGFQAPLPSSVLMTAVPARVAGVKEVIMVTPPQRDGTVAPVTLAAAIIAGVDRVFSIGGAQSIAALAYGTESVPAVDKIYGPGNIYVTLAKKVVYGSVGIDGLYGPSEVIIIADGSASPAYLAADLLAQAEHGSLATAMLITTSAVLAEKVREEVERQLADLPRREVAGDSLRQYGVIAVVPTVPEAIELANSYAPEHLCLVVQGAAAYVEQVENAGCLFIGEHSIEALVDYAAGPNHVLPTGGTARFSSPLNVTDFMKLISLVNLDEGDVRSIGPMAAAIARAEGLEAHARAVEKRLEDREGGR